MKFEDLPCIASVLKLYNTYYKTSPYDEVFLEDANVRCKYYKFDSLFKAYDFLKRNPKLEVRDDFFGKGFPFLSGNYNTNKSFYSGYVVIIRCLLIEDLLKPNGVEIRRRHIEKLIDIDFNNDREEFNELITLAFEENFYVFGVGTSFIKARSHDELKKKFIVASITDM